jgi:hypothetical protein
MYLKIIFDFRGLCPVFFQFDPAFTDSDIQLAPLMMPLRKSPYTFNDFKLANSLNQFLAVTL